MSGNQPSTIIALGRRPVTYLLNAPPLVICSACGHIDEPGDEVQAGGSGPVGWMDPICYIPDRCQRTRRGLARTEPTVIPIRIKHFVCDCCQDRIRNGRQDLFVLADRVEHGDHRQCGPNCKARRVAVSA
jgi:hypothetical protein